MSNSMQGDSGYLTAVEIAERTGLTTLQVSRIIERMGMRKHGPWTDDEADLIAESANEGRGNPNGRAQMSGSNQRVRDRKMHAF